MTESGGYLAGMTDINPTTHGSHASESYSSDRASSGTVSNGSVSTAGASRRLSTETKHSFKTTELPIFVLAVLGVLIASAIVDDTDFGAQEAWKYVTWLTIGYLVSRGLAKSGSRDFYDDDAGRHGGR